MASTQNSGAKYWGYLIQPDKSASPKLEQLCLGIAEIIAKLEPGTDDELTPARLAAFYRSVGGNYDSLFLKISDPGLSYLYKTLGCFHSLQPKESPFETPSLPALTPGGFVRWQTLQLLLCPEDHVNFIQRAVEHYDVPTADGGVFPKSMPRECFPDKPDEEMDKWHRMVTGSLEQAHIKRLKNSPFQSPRDAPERFHEGYFVPNGKGHVHRPRPSWTNPQDQEAARQAANHRRSSDPDMPSRFHGGLDPTSAWANEAPNVCPPNFSNFEPKHSPQNAMHRTSHSSQHRGSTATSAHHRHSSSFHRTSNGSTSYSPRTGSLANPIIHAHDRVGPYHQSSKHHNRKAPSTIDESSGIAAGSEEDHVQMRPSSTPKHAKDDRRRSSLFPPSIRSSLRHPRRHSHDASYTNGNSALPPRPSGYPHQVQGGSPLLAKPNLSYKHSNGERPNTANSGVKFHIPNFGPCKEYAVNSAPELPGFEKFSPMGKPPTLRYTDPSGQDRFQFGAGSSRESSRGNESERSTSSQRKSGAPIRISTVTGVGGRKYANAGLRSGGTLAPSRGPFPVLSGSASSPQMHSRMSIAGVGR